MSFYRLFFQYILNHPQVGDDLEKEIRPQLGGDFTSLLKSNFYQRVRQLPWGYIKLLIGKVKQEKEAQFYIHQTIENGWSRDVLALQIKSNRTSISSKGTPLPIFSTLYPIPNPIWHSKPLRILILLISYPNPALQ